MFETNRFVPDIQLVFTGEDRERLRDEIVKRFEQVDLRDQLDFKFEFDWEKKIEENSYEHRVSGFIRAIYQAGQLHWLILLADLERPNNPVFEELRARSTPPLPDSWPDVAAVPVVPPASPDPADPPGQVVAAATATTDPWHRVLLRNNRPFLDRATFREDCRLVGLGGARPILSVVGASDTGKSYTARYLVDVAKKLDDNQSLDPKEVLLDRLNGVVGTGVSGDIGGVRLADKLSQAIADRPLDPDLANRLGSEQDPTWAADAVNWILANAVETPLRWVILDGFSATVLSPTAQALLNSLLDQVAREGKIRIALLGYQGNLSFCAWAVREVRLDLADFTDPGKLKEHVLGYLLEVAAEGRARGRSLTDEQVLLAAREALSKVNPAEPDLQSLESVLTDIAERALVGS